MPKPLPGIACLSLGTLAACTATAPQAVTPTPQPSSAATAAPTATPTPVPEASTPWSFPSVVTSAPAPGGIIVIVSGSVYDASGAAINDAIVRVRSLDPSVPYEASTITSDGSYVVNNVPGGANVEIAVSKPGWTTRRRVGTFDRSAERNVVDFGGAGPTAAPFFLSKFPEIASTTPDTALTEPAALAYTLTLSEPLDAANRARFEAALRLFPANAAAAPGTAPADLTNSQDQAEYPASAWSYALAKGSAFLGASGPRAAVGWNERGDEATLSFAAPLLPGRTGPARYQLALVAGPDPILDADGNQLGTDRLDRHTAYPAAGNLVHGAIARTALPPIAAGATADERWAATHQLAAGFDVRSTGQGPRLLGAAFEPAGRDGRLALRFDKPLVAYNGSAEGQRSPRLAFTDAQAAGTPGYDVSDGAEADPLAMFTFAVDTAGSLAGSQPQAFDPTQPNAVWSEPGRAFRFARTSLTRRARGALVPGQDDGRITLEVDPDRPTTLYLYVFNRAHLFDARLKELVARVQDLQDPAGNAVDAGGSEGRGSL